MTATDANQPPPFEGRNLYLGDRALRAAVERGGAAWANDNLTEWGAALGSAEVFALAARANRLVPELRTHDRFGNRVDEVGFDPAWHELMMLAMIEGEHSSPWTDERAGAQVARAAAYLMHAEVENGTQCPLTMTFAAVPVLRRHAGAAPWLADDWLPRIVSRDYDPRALPVSQKTSALIGMGMTERQGGSDVRANTTRAEPAGGGEYRLTGHKWFFSAPMCDAHLVLAQAPEGLSCFLLPRVLPDGTRNAVRLQRLKDKLGNRSNASCEVEFDDAAGWLLGDEGRGVQTIIEMVQHTRLDCAIGSAGLVKSAAAQALHHARHRRAFGKRLAEQPLMQNVLADLTVEAEAAVASALRLAATFDAGAGEPERALARLATPALKYWLCKRAPMVAAEAIEVLGGNGYVEESALPRLYREAPLNSIWEGSGNIMCLDVLRAVRREPDAVAALKDELALARGADARLDRHLARLTDTLADGALDEAGARRLAGDIALALAASLLVRSAPAPVADAFCASRLGEHYGGALGTLPAGIDCAAVIAQAAG
ncbi:MAG TPA: isovaleryl-CoA dehydrogenase [Casimicrobiaceae bacterium]|jgi:putative acyl-CoA dehydrogenase